MDKITQRAIASGLELASRYELIMPTSWIRLPQEQYRIGPAFGVQTWVIDDNCWIKVQGTGRNLADWIFVQAECKDEAELAMIAGQAVKL